VEYLTPRLGQPVVYESRAGAGGATGMQFVAQSSDGHTFLVTSNAVATLPAMRRELGFDPFTDLVPVTLIAESPLVLAVRANGPASLPAYLARARETPGRLSWGTSGIGSATHLAGALLMQKAGVELLHVPYRGATVALNALLAGDTDSIIGDISIVLEHVRAGSVRALAVSTDAPSPLLPDVPTVASVVAGYSVPFWLAIFASRHNAPDANARLMQEIAPLNSPDGDLARRMAERGARLLLNGPDPLAQRMRSDVAQWRQVVAAAGITPE
jgi:tripartite-type tricarboxylate transporter receptor subunit TctC